MIAVDYSRGTYCCKCNCYLPLGEGLCYDCKNGYVTSKHQGWTYTSTDNESEQPPKPKPFNYKEAIPDKNLPRHLRKKKPKRIRHKVKDEHNGYR